MATVEPDVLEPEVLEPEESGGGRRRRRSRGGRSRPSPQTESLHKWLRQFSVDDGLTCDVYQVAPLPPGCAGEIAHVLTERYTPAIQDWQAHLKQLLIESKVARPGLFQLHFLRDGNLVRTKRLSFLWAESEDQAARSTMPAWQNPLDLFTAFQKIKEATAEKTLSPDGMASLFTTGLTTAMTLMAKIAPPAPAAPPRDALDEIQRTAAAIKALRDTGQPDTADAMTEQLKTTVLGKAMEVLTSGALAGAAPQPPTWGQLLIGVIPQLLPTINQGLALWGQSLQVRALEAQSKLRTPPPVTAVVPVGSPGPEPAPPGGSVLAPFRRAIIEGDPSVFPELYRVLDRAGAGALLAALRAGSVDYSMLVAQVGDRLPELHEAGAESFVTGFAGWLQAGGQPAAHRIAATCPACQADYTAEELAETNARFGRMACTNTLRDARSGAPTVCGATLSMVAA